MLSQLETAMDTTIKVFSKYCEKERDKYTLTKAELKDLLKKELKSFLKEQKYSKNVDNFMTELQCDNRVNFKEFMGLVTAITIAWKGFLDDDWKQLQMGQSTVNSKMLSQLETAMDTTIKVFSKYSGEEGDKYTLTDAELKDLLKKELKSFLKKQNKSVDKFMTELTCNEQVDFKEFMRLVTAITIESPEAAFIRQILHTFQLSELEKAKDRTIEVFYKYSGEGADKTILPKDKLSKLLEKKLKNFLKYRKDSEAVAHTMRDLDMNCDEQVDFKELMRLMTAITIACNDLFDDYRKNQGKQEVNT